MSHFSVTIMVNQFILPGLIEEAVEKALHPYWELDLEKSELIKDPRSEFDIKIKAADLKDEFKKFKKERKEDAIKEIKENNTLKLWLEFQYKYHYYDGKTENYPFARLKGKVPGWYYKDDYRYPDEVEGVQIPINDKRLRKEYDYFVENNVKDEENSYANEDIWLNDWHGYDYSAVHEAYGWWHNKQSKWDWHSIGGRWQGYFKLKPGIEDIGEGVSRAGTGDNPKDFDTDVACIKDIDFDEMYRLNKESAEKGWNKAHEPDEDGNKPDEGNMYFTYGIEKGMTKESYSEYCAQASTFALIDLDGEWHEKGHMIMFGVSTHEDTEDLYEERYKARNDGDEKEEERIDKIIKKKEKVIKTKWQKFYAKKIEDAPEGTMLVVVDCHI